LRLTALPAELGTLVDDIEQLARAAGLRARLAAHAGNGILFAVDDLDAAVASLKKRGIPIDMERETPACNMAMFTDTEGNSIFLHKRKR